MFKKSSISKATKLALAVAIAIPNFALSQAADQKVATKWIFSGDPAPKDLGFTPVRVGTGSDAEVQVSTRDWFLLRDPSTGMVNPTAKVTGVISGPVLDERNGQIYFSNVSGMILKESMIQRRWNAGVARRLI